MLKGVVVVESPAKAKTLSAYLGDDYRVIASYGHVRDLAPREGSVDTENHYKMVWEMNDRGKKQLKEITGFISDTNTLFLATDPDREGEAISWHILEMLKDKGALKNVEVKRVVFHEITKTAIKHAFADTKGVDMDLVNAYLARRVLDYLVGFSLSPVLWRKMPGARSAGRVQSVALRLIVERELEIQAFNPEEFWDIQAIFRAKGGTFQATLTHFDNEKLGKLSIKNEAQAKDIKEKIGNEIYKIDRIEKKAVKRNPYAPFTTSSMQQDAVRKLGFSSKKTMQIAQKLYEGVSVGGAMVGLITYMRTDSTNLSKEAVEGARKLILDSCGDKYLPKSPRVYKTKTKNAQEAHEAIRPTSFDRTPSSIKNSLSDDEYKLYDLIWKRALASQMESAIINQVSVSISSKSAVFKATGSTIGFDGFLKVYVESTDNPDDEQKDNKKLPELLEGEQLTVQQMQESQHFTQPPPRFNEASLVKKLEDLGIGRPSTYASIINVLQVRKYVILNKRTFIPQNIGFMTTSFLRNFFNKYIQYDFTANLEESLDDISNGKSPWEKILDNFWTEFKEYIKVAGELSITNVIDIVEKDIEGFVFQKFKENRKCPMCENGEVHLKFGRFGAFLGCSNYPECRLVEQISSSSSEGEEEGGKGEKKTKSDNEPIVLGKDPKRNNDTVFLKKGPYGYYLEWEKTKNEIKKKKPKRIGIPKCIAKPTEITIDYALRLASLPLDLGDGIFLCNGRFGPFLKKDKKSYSLGKVENFLEVTKEEAVKIIIDSSKGEKII
ncbi:MAG: type I DNA topoisomerase [Holosporales bacterium]|nr:type I DNA topoisomerase [Holosporales bacterium]